jgi:ssDNA-binding Zn-finger/Zn-ribbon topoisomerase 1
MGNDSIKRRHRAGAKFCENCPVCRRARKQQKGAAYGFVKRIEEGLCPGCKGYEKVHRRKAHEPLP